MDLPPLELISRRLRSFLTGLLAGGLTSRNWRRAVICHELMPQMRTTTAAFTALAVLLVSGQILQLLLNSERPTA